MDDGVGGAIVDDIALANKRGNPIAGVAFPDQRAGGRIQSAQVILISIQEIADIIETKTGTIKSQCGAIYRKANVKGRNELVAYFVEDLLAGESLGIL